MIIEICNPIESRTDKKGAKALNLILSYQSVFWRKTRFGMRASQYTKSLIKQRSDGNYYFLTGFIPRIRKEYPSAEIRQEFTKPAEKFKVPKLKGITFRLDQNALMASAIEGERGVIESPTGSGKTILQLGIISSMPEDYCTLLLAHTKDIVMQTVDEMKKFGMNPQMVMEGDRRPFTANIIVGTIQTLSLRPVDDYCTYFDLVIVDEAHRVSSVNSLYSKVLGAMLAPRRLGFTATKPTSAEALMALEGLLGPTIAQLTINEASRMGIIAKPKLRLIKLPENLTVKQQCRSYDEVVDKGIVKNRARTDKIVTLIRNNISHKKVVLVMVNQIEHGQVLREKLAEFNLDVPFVHGATSAPERLAIKMDLSKKKIFAAICTTVWREGINIPSINTIILGHLGKSEVATLQNIGRGLRRTSDKEMVNIVDFFDPSHPMLIKHFGERLCLYFNERWI